VIGSPLPIAIYERKLKIVSGSPAYVLTKLGRLDAACVDFDTTGPTFRATTAGKYLVLWCSQSKHETIEVSVTAPTAAAITRNEAKWQKGTYNQPMSGTYSYPTGWIDPVLTITNQTRPLMPFGHVSHSVLVDLAQNEQFAFSVTGEADREWTLVAWRMPEHREEFRNPVVQTNPSLSVSASGAVSTTLTSLYEATRRRVVLSANDAWARYTYSVDSAVNGLNYVARVRLFRSSVDGSPAGGTVTLNIILNGTTISTIAMTIPSTDAVNSFIQFVFPFVVPSGVNSVIFEFRNPNASTKQLEAEMFMERE
jgi:hypothetical protein